MRPLLLAAFFAAGCVPFAATSGQYDGPIGMTSRGVLKEAASLNRWGEGYRFYNKRNRR